MNGHFSVFWSTVWELASTDILIVVLMGVEYGQEKVTRTTSTISEMYAWKGIIVIH